MSKAPILMTAIRPGYCLVPLWVLAALGMGWLIAQSWAPMRAKAQGSLACQSLVRPGSPAADQSQHFTNAMEDVKSIEDCEHWDGLEVISPSNPNLIWDSTGKWVLMVRWVKDKPSGTERTSFDSHLWATTVPTIRSMLQREVYKKVADSLQAIPPQREVQIDVLARTRQYLGLGPDSEYLYFLEFWVSPKSLIRPCEDREVTDSRCTSRERPPAFTSKEFPFTGLGYTYDWGNPSTEVGATEFLVVPNAEIRIFQILDNKQYLSCDVVDSFPAVNMSVRRTCRP